MLESLTLLNFQAHRRLTIDFDPGVTTIIGPTDSGKSTILRALRWVCLNQFDGPADSFIRWGAASSKVKVSVDGHSLIRRKGSVNSYELDGREFRAFGADKVPDEIANLLRLTLGNFQGQLDSHFWFSESAGQVSRELNQIVNLEAMDEAMSAVASQARQAKVELDVTQARLDESLIARKAVEWVERADERLKRIETLRSAFVAQALRIEVLRGAVQKGMTALELKLRAGEQKERGLLIVSLGERACELGRRIKRLRTLIGAAVHHARMMKLPIPSLPHQQFTDLHQMIGRRESLSSLVEKLAKWRDKSAHIREDLIAARQDLKQQTGDKCPLCQRPLT